MDGQTLAELILGRKPDVACKFLRLDSHENTLGEALASMFVRKGFPEVDGLMRAEEWLLQWGAIAYVKVGAGEGKSDNTADYKATDYRCCICKFGGERYPEGIGSLAIVSTPSGYVEQFPNWKENPNIVVAFNNATYTPDLNIGFTAQRLTEYDISILYQIHYSRLYPIPLVHDEKTREAIQNALDNMKVGKYSTILSDNILSEIARANGTATSNAVELLQLSDPKASDHIQYLDHGRDDVLRWFWSLYGMNTQATSKMAQQNNAEIESGDNLSMVIPHARYHVRQEEVKALKDKFKWDVSIEFSEPWQSRLAHCLEEVKELEEDEAMGDSEDERPELDMDEVGDNSDGAGPSDSPDN